MRDGWGKEDVQRLTGVMVRAMKVTGILNFLWSGVSISHRNKGFNQITSDDLKTPVMVVIRRADG